MKLKQLVENVFKIYMTSVPSTNFKRDQISSIINKTTIFTLFGKIVSYASTRL